MPPPEWNDDLDDAFTRITQLDDEVVHNMHDEHHRRFVESEFHDWFSEAFMVHKDDPNNDVEPHDRYELREAWFAYMIDMGYDRDDFDWQEWREWMGYQ